MRNLRLMVVIAMAVGCIAMTAPQAEAGNPRGGMRGGIKRAPAVRNTVRGTGYQHSVFGTRQLVGRGGYGGFGGYGGGGFPVGNYGFGGYGFGVGLPYATGRIPTPPYFSIHPPVYYSRPVGRTYGYSPFAYPGHVRTPQVVVEPEPVTITNPYVDQKTQNVDTKKEKEPTPATKDGDFAKLEPIPMNIVNPYVDHPSQYPPAFDMEVTSAE